MSICKVHVPGDCAGNCEQCRSSVKAVTPAPKMGSRGPCCAHHIPLSRNCDACNVWAGGRAGSGQCTHGNTGFCSQCYERDDKSGWRARAEAAEQRARELDYKLGLALHDSEQGIADANESEACLKAENDALREKLAVATQGLQHIKAKTTNVMAMVWSEETLKKLGVE